MKKFVYSLLMCALVIGVLPSVSFAQDDFEAPIILNYSGDLDPTTSMVTLVAYVSDMDTGGSNVVNVDYYYNNAWSPMTPADGAFDSPEEKAIVTFSIPKLTGIGFCIKAFDAYDNETEPVCGTVNANVVQAKGQAYLTYPNTILDFTISALVTPAGTYIGKASLQLRKSGMVLTCNLQKYYSVELMNNMAKLQGLFSCSDKSLRALDVEVIDNGGTLNPDYIAVLDVHKIEMDFAFRPVTKGDIVVVK